MKKKWQLDNKGMTLLEVIVAFAIFAIATTILLSGFNIAYRTINNSNAIKVASQDSAGKLEMGEFKDADPKLSLIDIVLEGKPDSRFSINGRYYTGKATEKNDKTEIVQTIFRANELEEVPLPPVPEEKEMVPVVPDKTTEAYFAMDLEVYEGSFLKSDGSLEGNPPFKSEIINRWPTYVKKYGELNKGVVKTFSVKIVGTANNPSNIVVPADKHLEQLFFIGNPPLNALGVGHLTYCVKFMYLGSENPSQVGDDPVQNKMEMYITFKDNGDIDLARTTGLILQGYNHNSNKPNVVDSAAETTILYLPQNIQVSVSPFGKAPEGWENKLTILEKGFYEIPDNTDILRAVYNDGNETYENFNRKNKSGYARTYTQIKDKLKSIGVTVKSPQ